MEELLEELTAETLVFRADFLERYEKRVRDDFNRINEKYDLNTVANQLSEELGYRTERSDKTKRSIYNSKDYRKVEAYQDILRDFYYDSKGGDRIETRIKKEVSEANQSFDHKLEKLAYRIMKKGMKSPLKVVSSYMGVNFEATITDGEQTVTAYTIIAEGPVQRPHYRYLVK